MRDVNTGDDKPYYGWYITITLAITETISWGTIYYAFTVFITPMEADLGWSRGQLTGGFSLMLLIAGLMAFPVGTWIDKHGARLLMTVGSVTASLLVIAWSQVTTVTEFYLVFAGLGVCAAMILYEPAFAVIAIWFRRRRGTALAIITFAAGLASTIFVPLSDVLLNAFGWRDAVLVLGIALGVTTILPHALILRRRPDDLDLLPDGEPKQADQTQAVVSGLSLSTALHSRFFWMLLVSFGMIALASFTIRVHFIPFLLDVGIDSSTAALASGAIGIMQVVGRVIFAPMDAHFSARAMVIGVFTLQALAMGVLLLGTSLLLIGVFIIIFGTSVGALTLARPSIIADTFGTAHYGQISSIMAIAFTVSATAAPVGAGLLYDHFGSYDLVLWIILLLAIGAALVMFFAHSDVEQVQDNVFTVTDREAARVE